jgi:hypothetical protein
MLMATLVLQTIGSVAGGAIGGPIGSSIGGALGGFGGSFVDAALQPHASPRYSIGPRLKSMDGITSTEGAWRARVWLRAPRRTDDLGDAFSRTRQCVLPDTASGGYGGGGQRSSSPMPVRRISRSGY